MSNWSKGTVHLAVGMVALGFLLMVLAWNGAAGVDSPEQQFPYLLSGGPPGLGLVLTGLTLALVQEIRRASVRVLARLTEVADVPAAPTAVGPTAVPDDEPRVVAGRASYHRPDCRLVEGRDDLQTMAPEAAGSRGLAPCRVCRPDRGEAAA